MEIETIFRLLKNSGFNVLGTDGANVYLEDPSCILRSFQTFVEYAWTIIFILTALLLFGWAISMIRGSKHDIFTKLRNLILIFGVLSAAGPIINLIYGDDLFVRGCRTITVSTAELNRLLDARKATLQSDQTDLYEDIQISDTGAIQAETPYADAPLPSSGDAKEVIVTVSEDTNVTINPRLSNASGSSSGTASVLTPAPQSATSSANSSAPLPVRASAPQNSRDVIYENADGSRTRRTGGTRAWRNLNPGNIRYSDFARRVGAIGRAGGFAVFPDEKTGMRAIESLLRSNSYNHLTIAGAISRYAPPSENNTAGYHRRIEQLTGMSINRRMSDLSETEISRVATAIREIEGWQPGRIIRE